MGSSARTTLRSPPSTPAGASVATPFALARRALGVSVPTTTRIPVAASKQAASKLPHLAPPQPTPSHSTVRSRSSVVPPPLPKLPIAVHVQPPPLPIEHVAAPYVPAPRSAMIESEHDITRPIDIDPGLIAKSRERESLATRRRSMAGLWQGVKFVGVGFLVGAMAVHALALMRVDGRIDALNARIDEVVIEQERLAKGRGERVIEPIAAAVVDVAAPASTETVTPAKPVWPSAAAPRSPTAAAVDQVSGQATTDTKTLSEPIPAPRETGPQARNVEREPRDTAALAAAAVASTL